MKSTSFIGSLLLLFLFQSCSEKNDHYNLDNKSLSTTAIHTTANDTLLSILGIESIKTTENGDVDITCNTTALGTIRISKLLENDNLSRYKAVFLGTDDLCKFTMPTINPKSEYSYLGEMTSTIGGVTSTQALGNSYFKLTNHEKDAIDKKALAYWLVFQLEGNRLNTNTTVNSLSQSKAIDIMFGNCDDAGKMFNLLKIRAEEIESSHLIKEIAYHAYTSGNSGFSCYFNYVPQ